jgi:hypothetical protein
MRQHPDPNDDEGHSMFHEAPEPEVDDLPQYVDDAPSTAARQPGPLGFARMAGSSIAARDAAPWVTDFLNAAYFRRGEDRDVEDLRLAFTILTTYWYGKEPGQRLRLTDLPAFDSAFRSLRLDTASTPRGVLSHEQLQNGASALLGGWFPDAYADDARRGWGIAFASVEERDAYDPDRRMQLARLGELTPESAPAEEQVWHTYPPVEMPSAEATIAALTRPETWPDYATEIGRFTPLRASGLAGQTFEIEVAAGTASGRPVFTRGYVTITDLVTPDDPDALARWFDALEEGMRRYGDGEPRIVPEGGTPLVGFDLTTHQGHFMGSGHNRLVLYTHEDRAWVRAAGTWDPMPWHVERAYKMAGKEAQHAFWGQGDVAELSLLHQLARKLDA